MGHAGDGGGKPPLDTITYGGFRDRLREAIGAFATPPMHRGCAAEDFGRAKHQPWCFSLPLTLSILTQLRHHPYEAAAHGAICKPAWIKIENEGQPPPGEEAEAGLQISG
jgi:hypothetical protein